MISVSFVLATCTTPQEFDHVIAFIAQLVDTWFKPCAAPRPRRQAPGKRVFRPAILHLEDRIVLSSVDYWTGASARSGGNDNWSNGGNWSLGVVPGASDTAEFTSSESHAGAAVMDTATTVGAVNIDSTWGGTLTVSAPLTISGNFTFASGTLNGNGTISASGSGSAWSGGYINFGTGSLSNAGTLTISGSSNQAFAGTLTNTGTIVNTSTSTVYAAAGGTTINNEAGATFDIQAAATLTSNGLSDTAFNNAGTLERSTGSGMATISFPVNNTGTIAGDSGTLALTGGGSGNGSDTITAAAGGIVSLGGSYTGTFAGSGAGSVLLAQVSTFTGAGASGVTLNFSGGVLQWMQGALGGTVTNAGTLTISGSSNQPLTGTLANTETIIDTSTSAVYAAADGTTINNEAGATFDIQAAATLSSNGLSDNAFNNAGTLERSTGSGMATISFPVNNTGTIAGDSATLALTGGGSGSGSDTITAAAGGIVSLGGSYTGTFAGSGAGLVLLAQVSTFTGAGTSGATLNFSGTVLQWMQGALAGTVTNAGTLTISGDSDQPLTGTLANAATIIDTSTGAVYAAAGGTTINNEAGAIFDIQAAATLSSNGLSNTAFNNAGTLERSTGSGTATISFPVNGGTIEGDSGTLALAGGGSGGIVFDVAQGATVDLTGGNTAAYTGSLSGSGSGTVQLASGNFYPGLGGVMLNFSGSLFQWTGGSMELSVGDVTNLGTINLSGSNETQIYADGTLDNFGTIIQTGTGNFGLHSDNISPTTLKIEPGAAYLIESDAGINNSGLGDNVIDNVGTIRKTAGTGTSTLSVPTQGFFSNTGTIEADSGTLDLAATIAQASGTTLTGGTWNALDGATLQFPSGTAITSNEGNLTLDGSGATIGGIAGLASNSGTFVVTGGADFTTAGGFTNSGNLTVGAGSILTVAGNFTQTSTGSLSDQIGGTPASGLFGKVACRGRPRWAGPSASPWSMASTRRPARSST